MNVVGKNGKGRPIKRWVETIENDIRVFDVSVENENDRHMWRNRVKVADPK